jgi:hypothetical protein
MRTSAGSFPIRPTMTGLIVGALLLAGCASAGVDGGSSNLTAGMAKLEIERGITTQAEILQVFGAPNIVTISSEEGEVWNYNRMAFESVSSAAGILAVLWPGSTALAGGAGTARSSSSTRSFDLILVFDIADVVQEYTVIQAVYDRP